MTREALEQLVEDYQNSVEMLDRQIAFLEGGYLLGTVFGNPRVETANWLERLKRHRQEYIDILEALNQHRTS